MFKIVHIDIRQHICAPPETYIMHRTHQCIKICVCVHVSLRNVARGLWVQSQMPVTYWISARIHIDFLLILSALPPGRDLFEADGNVLFDVNKFPSMAKQIFVFIFTLLLFYLHTYQYVDRYVNAFICTVVPQFSFDLFILYLIFAWQKWLLWHMKYSERVISGKQIS